MRRILILLLTKIIMGRTSLIRYTVTVMDLSMMMKMMVAKLPKTHPKPIVVEIFISRFFKGKSGVVAGCVTHPCNQHLPQGRVNVKEEGPYQEC